MDETVELPEYEADQFRLDDAPECDMIMKGGITSGIVYPYAVLEIATKYRLRAVGGTSAGAIAAAFAAAAEYGRRSGSPEAFLTLKQYCDQLPERLPSLFQPDPELEPAIDRAKDALAKGGRSRVVWRVIRNGLAWGLAGSAWLGALFFASQAGLAATILACLLGLVLGGLYGAIRAGSSWAAPLIAGWQRLPGINFGFCTGLTQEDGPQALTDWMHEAIQRIAFGDSGRDKPLTFGDLAGSAEEEAPIDLKIVTTNLSMRRPHTLPRLGAPAAFLPEEWRKLFPPPIMDHLFTVSEEWESLKGARSFPGERDLPVVVAVRMSLSFPLLFTAVPLQIEDRELPSIVRSLGGCLSEPRIRTALFSDGGLSSNFPIHMFDAPLPVRPTFAFSLEDLFDDVGEVERRVALPDKAGEGMGVPVKEIVNFADFGWQIISSAKDWQDQTLSEISGQRERIARIYLKSDEGGLNLSMPPELSLQLMRWGFEAGRKFIDGSFDFDEHKWRRLLVLYKHLTHNLEAIDAIWDGGFEDWYRSYYRDAKSYRRLALIDRRRIAAEIGDLAELRRAQIDRGVIRNADEKLPRKSGVWKVGPRY